MGIKQIIVNIFHIEKLRRGPLGFIWDFFKHGRDANISMLASSMAYATVISFIPWLAISLSLLRMTGGTEKLIKRAEPLLLDFFLPGVGANLIKPLQVSLERVQSGVVGVVGIVGMVLTTLKLFHELDRAQVVIWNIQESRSFWKRLMMYLLITFSVPISMVFVFSFLGPKGLDLFKIIPKDFVGALFIWGTLFSVYKWWPVVKVRVFSAMLSSLWVVFLIAVLEVTYSHLIKKFFALGKVYGSLATVPIFLIWLQLIWVVILMGVALTATIEKRSKSVS